MLLKIAQIVYPGKSFGIFRDKALFTDEGLPGELVEVEIIQDKKDFFNAKTIKIIKASEYRVKEKCSHYKVCSPYQIIDYPNQLKIKESQLREMFSKKLNLSDLSIKVIPSPLIWGYRNKINLKLAEINGVYRLAYNQPGKDKEFYPIDKCWLSPDLVNDFIEELSLSLQDIASETIKEVTIRNNIENDILLSINLDSLADFARIQKVLPKLSINFKQSSGVCLVKNQFGSHQNILWGKNNLKHRIYETDYFIGSESFFQVNSLILKDLLEDINSLIEKNKFKTLADLYCGVGTFGLAFAKKVKTVLAVELDESNIFFLKKNITANNIENCLVSQQSVETWTKNIKEHKIDLAIIDPPRDGLKEKISSNLAHSNIPNILYLSCGASTLIRDLTILKRGYKIESISFYDFFPQTGHIETLVFLKKK
ncbi:MAG: 23S rRNA (uracil(1939)-C(5))-methyltransferase RlmD [Candidatus Omnitrophica bacterium]|nr:23S rRNA (uracil(1939)-C(5))-methyltransferase RlmD [Candidatus Omnitrophota bacterium]